MSHINNQTQDLNSIELVQDLDHESAATISGGIQVFSDANFSGFRLPSQAVRNLELVQGGVFNDEASSLFNETNQVWAFYSEANFRGKRLALRPGQFARNLDSFDFNDAISSYRSEPSF
ncbi:peptidase inhibitor family I36 protein [Nostoc sp. FACHB-152]|uniref:peptidase inhibitor family I36 protein n=1 Tax=Nostoc sp. FACHB-152 TaxID=2692837 RepID=UPI001686A6C9|nr:peptidase inhibitor family I36 protein [Nostoc sp. FACHB-152]MBD2452212.1 peptidase inhibitor family I36 protein [Nostoc sp. FACHB-152]